MTRYILSATLLSLMLLLASLPSASQEEPRPDESARLLAPTQDELPAGLTLKYEIDHAMQAGAQSDYLALQQYYEIDTANGKIGVILTFGQLENRTNAAEAYKNYRASHRPRRTKNLVGDVTSGEYPFLTLFQLDKAVVSINIIPAEDFSGDLSILEELADSLADISLEKSKLRGNIEADPLNLTTNIVSSTASGPGGDDVEVIFAVNNQDLYPTTFRGGIFGASQQIFSLEPTVSEDGQFTFRWDGLDSTGNLVSPGEYELTVSCEDILTRITIASITVTVESPRSENTSLSAMKDVVLSQRERHRNDGQNPVLTLEKLQGKATRSAVAFELSNTTNLAGLFRATLVLTIDSSQAVNGWGNGRTISAQAITQPWEEGNGWHFGLKKKDQITGDGSGATWFSPADEDISNDSSNSAVNWDGATSSVYPPTAPSVQIANFQSGEVAFDVTTDVLNGAENGWLILKDQENVGSKVSFYSREGAAAVGNPDLAPRLLLEFGDPVASAAPSNGLLAEIGFGSIGTKFRSTRNGSELRSVREILQDSPVAALATEQLLFEATRTNPVLNLTARTAYRSWLAEDLRIAAVPVRFA